MRSRQRIGLLETEPIRAAGFRSVFEGKLSIEIVPVDVTGLIADRSLSVALLGLHNSTDAFETLAVIKAARPNMRLILMGLGATDEIIINAIAAGAKGYLEDSASAEQVEQAIEVVTSGSIWAPRRVLALFVDRVIHSSAARALRRNNSHFTEREREVLKLLVSARSNREIAEDLNIEERTVKAHVARLMRKVGVDNRIALSVHAVTNELLSKESSLVLSNVLGTEDHGLS
ncbi:MAG TPA: response regulator transcription factor [Acidisarcina sp.]